MTADHKGPGYLMGHKGPGYLTDHKGPGYLRLPMAAMSDQPDASATLAPSQPAPPEPADDGELACVLEGFLSGLEAGRRPNAQQLIAEHPAIADRLRTCLASLQFLEQAAGELSAGRIVSEAEPAGGTLGDYRLLREVGRGGMGVVYEAEQISLRRRVALKVLPYAAALDKRALERFKNEALAAAALDHPNIVPLFGIGCERSIHFYAMRFIDGPTLADCIRELQQRQRENSDVRFDSLAEVVAASSHQAATDHPAGGARRGMEETDPTAAYTPSPSGATAVSAVRDAFSTPTDGRAAAVEDSASSPPQQTGGLTPPARRDADDTTPDAAAAPTRRSFHTPAFFRSVAELAAQIADALDHAHEQGVIHRDIKPSNLILDQQGKPYVADFGLARIGSDTAMTVTGDVVGTLRYMSPEQALANRGGVDHRTDIYSLGVTLYELLTLRAPFEARNRWDILRLIESAVPPAATLFDAGIPRELETILFRSLEKDPADRYSSAREFAQDLRRFTAGEPVAPRRPGFARRATRWSLRHAKSPGLASRRGRKWTIATVACGALLILAGAILYVRLGKELVRIELLDPSLTVRVDEQDALVFEGLGAPIHLRPGEHDLIVDRDGMHLGTKEFTVARGDDLVLRVTRGANSELIVLWPGDEWSPPVADDSWTGWPDGIPPLDSFATLDAAPHAVSAGFFNQDAHLDLAVIVSGSDAASSRVVLMAGTGNGAFSQVTSADPGASDPAALVSGDFNGDGKLDVAVTHANGDLSFLAGDGLGHLQMLHGTGTSQLGSGRGSIVAADFNRDGALDLAVTYAVSNTVGVFLNSQEATPFLTRAIYGSGGQRPEAIAVGHFDDDGKLDLAVANVVSHALSVLRGDGAGGFGSPTAYASNGLAPVALAAFDFNRDGRSELAVANIHSDSVTVFTADGNGGLTPLGSALPAGLNPLALATADLNRDGYLDLAAANNDGNDVIVFPGSENGFSAFGFRLALPSAARGPIGVQTGPFNGDAWPDLVVLSSQTRNITTFLIPP